jgi:hypothetical protein
VVSEVSAQGSVEVQLPVGKARVPVTALSAAGPAIPRRDAPISWTAGAGDSLTTEINVIGCTVEEATQRVGRYLEDAMLGGLARAEHSRRRVLRRHRGPLQEHPLVAGFSSPPSTRGCGHHGGPGDVGRGRPSRRNRR